MRESWKRFAPPRSVHAGRYVARKRSVWRWAVLGHYKMGKRLQLTIEEDRFDCQRKPASIEREAVLDIGPVETGAAA
jgi:hypothetical protein